LVRTRLPAVQTNQTILYDSVYDRPAASPKQDAVKIRLIEKRSIAAGWSRLLRRKQTNASQARCDYNRGREDKPKVKEQCHGSFLKAQRAVSHASWPCKQPPIPRRLAAMSGRPSVTPIA